MDDGRNLKTTNREIVVEIKSDDAIKLVDCLNIKDQFIRMASYHCPLQYSVRKKGQT